MILFDRLCFVFEPRKPLQELALHDACKVLSMPGGGSSLHRPDESTKLKPCSHAAGPAKDTSCHSGNVQFQSRDPNWNDTSKLFKR